MPDPQVSEEAVCALVGARSEQQTRDGLMAASEAWKQDAARYTGRRNAWRIVRAAKGGSPGLTSLNPGLPLPALLSATKAMCGKKCAVSFPAQPATPTRRNDERQARWISS